MKIKKVAFYGLGALAVIIILLLLLPTFVNMDRFKGRIVSSLEEATGRNVELSSISLSLFPWIGARISGVLLENAEGFSKVPQLRLDVVRVKVRLIPLLFNNIRIKEIMVIAPEILIEKKDKIFNFSDLISKSEEVKEEKVEEEEKDRGFLKRLSLDELALTKGVILFQELEGSGKPVRSLRLENINIKVKDLSNDLRASFNISFNIPEGKEQGFRMTGSLGPGWADDFKKSSIDLSLQVKNLELKRLSALSGTELPGVLDTNLFVRGSFDDSIESGGDITLSRFFEGISENIMVTENLEANMKEQSLLIKSLRIQAGIPLIEINGKVHNFMADKGTGKDLTIDVSAKSSIPLNKLTQYKFLSEKLPKPLSLDGLATLTAELRGGIERMFLKAMLDLKDAIVLYSDIINKPKGEKLLLSAEAVREGNFLRIPSLKLELLDAGITLNGSIRSEKPYPSEIQISTTEVSLKSLSKVFSILKSYNSSGSFQLNGAVSGPFLEQDRLALKGTLVLTNVSADIKGIPKRVEGIEGKASFTRDDLSLSDFKARVGESSMRLNLLVKGFEKPVINLNLYMPRLNLDELLESPPAPKKQAAPEKSGPLLPEEMKRVTATGKLRLDSARIKKAEVKNMQADIELQNNILEIKNASLEAFGGSCGAGVRLNASQPEPVFGSELHIKEMDINAILSTFSSYKDTIYGRVFTDLNLEGRGAELEEIKKTITGKGVMTLKEGKIATFSAAKQLLGVSNLSLSRFKGASETKLKELKTSVRIEKGRVHTQDMNITSEEMNMRTYGSFGFDSTLDYKGEAVFSKEISDKMQLEGVGIKELGGVLKDENGRVVVPFILGGRIKSPKFSLDMAVAKEKAKKVIQKKVEEQINKEIKKTLGSEKGEDVEKKAKEKLKKLFK